MFIAKKVAGCQDEDVVNTAVEPGAVPGCGVAISPDVGEVREGRLDANVGVFVDI